MVEPLRDGGRGSQSQVTPGLSTVAPAGLTTTISCTPVTQWWRGVCGLDKRQIRATPTLLATMTQVAGTESVGRLTLDVIGSKVESVWMLGFEGIRKSGSVFNFFADSGFDGGFPVSDGLFGQPESVCEFFDGFASEHSPYCDLDVGLVAAI